MDDETKQKLDIQLRRLDYALLQFSREAKFMQRWNREHDRFFRGYDALVEAHSEIENIVRPWMRIFKK